MFFFFFFNICGANSCSYCCFLFQKKKHGPSHLFWAFLRIEWGKASCICLDKCKWHLKETTSSSYEVQNYGAIKKKNCSWAERKAWFPKIHKGNDISCGWWGVFEMLTVIRQMAFHTSCQCMMDPSSILQPREGELISFLEVWFPSFFSSFFFFFFNQQCLKIWKKNVLVLWKYVFYSLEASRRRN